MAKRTLPPPAYQCGASAEWRYPEQLVARGTALLKQQCWYWGCDIRRPEGNLLLAHGFARVRPPEGFDGSSCYALEPMPITQLKLWGFGIYVGRAGAGGLFLDRFRCEPRLLEAPRLAPTVWRKEHLPDTRRACGSDREQVAVLLANLIGWIVGYEQQIIAQHGLAYREACLTPWTRGRLSLAADTVLPAWERLAAEVAACCECLPSPPQGAINDGKAL